MEELAVIQEIAMELVNYLIDNGIKQKVIAEKLEVSSQYIGQVKQGKSKLTYDNIVKLVLSFPQSRVFLGEFSDLVRGEKPKTEFYKKLIEPVEPIEAQQPKANILHVPAPAEAGFLGGVINPLTNEDLFPYYIPGFRGLGYSFEVKGNSMLDTLRPGEFVITDRTPLQRTQDVINDFIYVIASPDEILIKRVNKHKNEGWLWLVSDNESFDEIEYEMNEHTKLYKGRRTIQWNLSKKMRYG